MLLSKNKYLFRFFLLLSLCFSYSYANKSVNIIFASNMTNIFDLEIENYAKLSTLLNTQRNSNPDTLFLFGGDSLGPSSLSTLDKGVHIIDILNTLEPDMVSVNKRELVYLPEELSLRSFEAVFPFVSSNLYDPLTKSNIDGINDNLLIKKGSIIIGIISIINYDVVEEYGLKRIIINDIEKSIVKQSKQLRQKGANFIILLPSNAFNITQKLLDNKSIDLILEKDTYKGLKTLYKVQNDKRYILITKKGLVSSITLSMNDKNKKISFDHKLLSLKDYKEDKKITSLIKHYEKKINLLFKEKIGVFVNAINTNREIVRAKESIFGNILADALKFYTKSDISLINGGSIRGETTYEKNFAVSRRDIVKELPFRNKISLIELHGKQLLEALENGVSLVEESKGRFPHLSGITITYNKKEVAGKRIKTVFINEKKLDLNKKYRLATSDYLASGGDGYVVFKDTKVLEYSNPKHRLISNILIEYIIEKQKVFTKLEGRIKEVSNEKF